MASRQQSQVPSGASPQRRCARGWQCSAKTRDAETGEWVAAAAYQPLCPADRMVLVACLGELPGCYGRLGVLAVDPARRRGRAVRVMPGSRVLVSPEADALLRELAGVVAGWAARVRAVPQISSAPHGLVPGSVAAVEADCRKLADFPDVLLALAPGPMARMWTWPAGAVMPEATEREIGDLTVKYAGDGWAVALTRLDGEDAALELFGLRERAVRMLGETPAPPDLLDGVPCRACEAMSSLEVLPQEPPDRGMPEGAFCRCSVPGCRDEMTRAEYDGWVRQYAAWTRGAGVVVCRRCQLGRCADCVWRGCGCKADGHPKAA